MYVTTTEVVATISHETISIILLMDPIPYGESLHLIYFESGVRSIVTQNRQVITYAKEGF